MPPFEPANWVSLGVTMPSRAEVPVGLNAFYKNYLYVVYQGEYQNVTAGYSQATNPRVGAIYRTQDGVTWTLAWEGNSGLFGYQRWQPGNLFVIGNVLYAFIHAGGANYFVNNAYNAKGAIGLIQTTDGLSWSLVTLFTEWPEMSYGSNSPPGGRNWTPAISHCAWFARESGPDGEDAWWVIIGWDVGVSGTLGSFSSSGTDAYRSIDGGATWELVRNMRGTYPWVTGASGPGPWEVQAARRLDQPGYPERWFMFGGSGTLNYSDNQGVSWAPSSYFGQQPFGAFVLRNSGVVAFGHGTAAFGPDAKISCNFGQSYTTVSGAGAYIGPANAAVVPVQFGGIEELLVVMRDNVDSSTKTAIWYTTTGGEVWTKLGTLSTVFFVPYYLAWVPSEPVLVMYTRDRAVWACEDEPAGEATPRAICPLLFEPVEEPPYMPGNSGVGPPIRVRVDSEPHNVPTPGMREGGYVPSLPRREKPFGA